MSSRRKVAFEKAEEEDDLPQEEEEEEIDLEDDEDEDEDEDVDFDEIEAMNETLASYLTTEDGDNIATALMSINDNLERLANTMETQNKILVKLVSEVSKSSK